MSESKTNISPAKKGRNRKKGVIAIVLVMALVIGGTLAYLGTRSNDKENVFEGSKDISLTLTEPKWDDIKANEEKTEAERAKEYTPGGIYLKNPKLYNSSDNDAHEWVAMKISFQLEDLEKMLNDSKTEVTRTTYSDDAKKLIQPIEKDKIVLKNVTWEEIRKLINIQITNTGTDSATVPYITGFNSDWHLICTSKDVDDDNKLLANFDYRASKTNTIENDATWAIFVYQQTISQNTTTIPEDDNTTPRVNEKDIFDSFSAGSFTASLFDRIQVLPQKTLITNGYKKANSNQADKASYPEANVYLPKFEIKVEGAAIKNEIRKDKDTLKTEIGGSDGLTDDEAKSVKKELIGLFGVDTSNLS